ncbi:flagellar biosynthesis protein FlaG [Xenophilus sp. AP218F]|nr:flagellar protein FlaG [Chromobacterium sp. ASV5]OWY37908.1 flagellar biosynthesis protein FlaG [Xenophilus sp. AP218F]
MQIPSLQAVPVSGSAPTVTNQQLVGLAQPGNGQAAAVLPDSANAVTAAGQAQGQQQAASQQQTEPDIAKQLQESVKQLNNTASLYNSNLQFSVDKDTGTTVVKVVDTETKQVIRQIPSEEALRIAKAIGDFKGLLLKDKA